MGNLFFFVVTVVPCVFVFAQTTVDEDLQKFMEGVAKVQKQIDEKHKSLQNSDRHDEYVQKTSEDQARFIFDFFDENKDQKLNRDELIRFGRLSVSNDTESAAIYADVTLQADKNNDAHLTFDEFFQPKILYGGDGYSQKQRDDKHQHKEGFEHPTDPRQHAEL